MARNKTSAAPPSAAPPSAAPQTSAVPGTEAQTIIQAAAQAIPPESTLGDGDATGAGAEAALASTAPEAPEPEAPAPAAVDEKPYGPEGWTVWVTGPARGRWRAGRKFGPEAVAIAADELTDADMEKLLADPELKVEIAGDEG